MGLGKSSKFLGDPMETMDLLPSIEEITEDPQDLSSSNRFPIGKTGFIVRFFLLVLCAVTGWYCHTSREADKAMLSELMAKKAKVDKALANMNELKNNVDKVNSFMEKFSHSWKAVVAEEEETQYESSHNYFQELAAKMREVNDTMTYLTQAMIHVSKMEDIFAKDKFIVEFNRIVKTVITLEKEKQYLLSRISKERREASSCSSRKFAEPTAAAAAATEAGKISSLKY